jgi:hypothetical protein
MRSFVISRLRAALAIVAFTAAAGAHAQLALNGTSTASVTVTNTTLAQTVAHTTPALANRVMLVAVHMNVNNSPGATVASVTYAGQPLFLVAALTEAGNDVRTELWAIIGPATGANNVVVTAAGVTAGAPNDAVIGVTTWIDVNTTAGALYTAEGSSNTPTSTLAGTAAGDIVADFMSARQNAGGTVTATVGAGQTSIYNALSPNVQNVDDVRAAASYETSTGANVTTSYTLASVQEWVKAGVNMKPAITDVDIKGQATPDLVDGSPTQVSFVYTITANGLGANNVNFSTTLPAGLTLVSATSTQGACAAGPPTTCAIGSLMNAGDSATVTVVATTAAGGIATIYNVVGSVTVGTSDSVAGNNSATVTVRTQSKLCANPGKDGAGGTITGSVNTYYPATANAASGTASITLGAVPAGYGATNIAIGDLLLVMQMQDATIDSSNNDRYGGQRLVESQQRRPL